MRKQRKQVVLENILVLDYAAEGKSLSRVDGKVVFIEGAVPGDVVDVEYHKKKKNYADAQVTAFYSRGATYSPPFCPHFNYCSGCKWQQMRPFGIQRQRVLDPPTHPWRPALLLGMATSFRLTKQPSSPAF